MRGHQITVVDFPARQKAGRVTDNVRSIVLPAVFRTNSRSSVRLIRPGLINASGIARASSVLNQFKTIFAQALRWCDVVVLYSVPTNGLQTIVSSRLASKPLIFHSFDILHEMTGYGILRFPTWALERLVYRSANKVVVISSLLADYMRTIGVPEEKIVLLPAAIDVDRFSPSVSGSTFRAELGLSRDDLMVLFSGWLYEFSGLDAVMNDMQNILAEVPQLKLVICGDGPLLNSLNLLKAKLSLDESVRIIGRRPYDEMPRIIAASDLCVNPYLAETRSDFAFPSKIVEYMAAGKPVIASDLPGTRSMLGDSSGVVLSTPSQIGRALEDLLLDSGKRLELGKQARKYCEDHFSLKAITDRFETLLEQVVHLVSA
jgi:glycosyltransferase involved in cell wall biosynthesis